MSRLRSALYRSARLLGDVEAAAKGPAPFVRRRVRARTMARGLGNLSRVFRLLGLHR